MSDYLDASVLVSLFLEDAHSAAATAYALTDPDIITSHWALAEVSSAFAVQARLGRLGPSQRLAADQNLDLWIADQPSPLTPTADDFGLARAMVQTSRVALRAPDALHLAICLRLNLSLTTFDKRLAEAAVSFGAPLAAI